ncbi:MAG TPA: cellulase family glycosylhydrolase [Ktedonobacteraceae bacterium]|nr:cellulase family glycosylhydrolase [Ktedonobacteraceae bacterium]
MKKGTREYLTGSFLVLLLLFAIGGSTLPARSAPIVRPPTRAGALPIHHLLARAPQLHVSGNLLVDQANRPVRLIGADRSGTEYMCLGYGIFDGPHDQASINAMLSWRIQAVRVPLNEDCWLNVNMGSSRYGGLVYQQAVEQYVQLLINNGITPILDLHWTAPGSQPARGQEPMPDRDHAPTFWFQVASAFKGNNAVIFDLFNEPYPDNNHDTLAAWSCWRDGTNPRTCPYGSAGMAYNAAGMQELVNAVRSAGATNIILLGGIQYASTLDRWAAFAPVDPARELAVSWHLYNFSGCNIASCWSAQGTPIMRSYPVVLGEIGQNGSGGDFITRLMTFLDHPGPHLPPQSYLAWAWNTDQTVFDLIDSYQGHPTSPYGVQVQQHALGEAKYFQGKGAEKIQSFSIWY